MTIYHKWLIFAFIFFIVDEKKKKAKTLIITLTLLRLFQK